MQLPVAHGPLPGAQHGYSHLFMTDWLPMMTALSAGHKSCLLGGEASRGSHFFVHLFQELHGCSGGLLIGWQAIDDRGWD